MTTVGDVAEVTVTYNSNAKDAADVTAKQNITCVDAQAALGNKLFAVKQDSVVDGVTNIYGDVNVKSGCAKFYLGLSDTSAKIALDTNQTIYFCAKDDKGEVIRYDSYEVESSNDNIVNASVANATTGKFVEISATANTIGNAQLNVTASKNGKKTSYTIPVTTYKAGVPVKMTLTIDKPIMSDANDSAYTGKVTAQLLDADGNAVKGDFIAKVADNNATTPVSLDTTTVNGTTKAEFKVNANNATDRTYTIEVTGADNNDYTTPFTRRVNVTVKALPTTLKNITYNIELTKSTLDVAKKSERETEAKLYATCNGLFAGYVNMADMKDSADSEIAGKKVATGEAIKNVTMSAIFGTETYGQTNGLVSTGTAVNVVTGGGLASIKFKAVDETDTTIDTKSEVAKLGNYTVKFEYIKNTPNARVESRTTSVAVKNSYPTPTVKVTSTKVDNVSVADIINDCLITNVDMNNDVSGHESILDLCDKDKLTATPVSNKLIAKYAQVQDNIGAETWLFYVPVNTTFTQR